MPLKTLIEQEFIQAMKQSDKLRIGVLRYFKSVLQRAEIDQRKKLDEPAVLKLLQKEIKKRKDAVEQFQSGGRKDLVEKETQELKVLEQYAPKQLSEAEVEAIVAEVVASVGPVGPKEMGKVMSAVMEKLGGRADGSLVARMVKQKLQR